jgi:hypothetical protein
LIRKPGTIGMTAQTILRGKIRHKAGGLLMQPFIVFVALIVAAESFVFYALWPNWPSTPISLDAPSIPVTVAGVLFDVPPAAIRAAVQRHPGSHERIDLAFLWPSLQAPQPDLKQAVNLEDDGTGASAQVTDRLFVTIGGLGAVLPPIERLRTIYARYIGALANAGKDGLAILPFRIGTPYEGEDLVYFATNPEQFFALCTRTAGTLPGTCIHERALDAAEITMRFPRDWLDDWRATSAGFDRLVAQIHPQGN